MCPAFVLVLSSALLSALFLAAAAGEWSDSCSPEDQRTLVEQVRVCKLAPLKSTLERVTSAKDLEAATSEVPCGAGSCGCFYVSPVTGVPHLEFSSYAEGPHSCDFTSTRLEVREGSLFVTRSSLCAQNKKNGNCTCVSEECTFRCSTGDENLDKSCFEQMEAKADPMTEPPPLTTPPPTSLSSLEIVGVVAGVISTVISVLMLCGCYRVRKREAAKSSASQIDTSAEA